jgi:predicted nucleic acid-binding protein
MQPSWIGPVSYPLSMIAVRTRESRVACRVDEGQREVRLGGARADAGQDARRPRATCPRRAAAYIAALRDQATIVEDATPVPARTADADDDYLIALAQAHGADAIVSGDRHLFYVASNELQVLAPREMADCLGLASGGRWPG